MPGFGGSTESGGDGRGEQEGKRRRPSDLKSFRSTRLIRGDREVEGSE